MKGLDLKDKKVLVIGFGKSGVAVVDFLIEEGGLVIVNDIKERCEFEEDKISDYESKGVEFVFGKHEVGLCYEVGLIVTSPGVDPGWIPFVELSSKGIDVLSEIELAYRFSYGKIIGITGTNGKTTVTALLGELFKDAGYKVSVCGNIGKPFIKVIHDREDYDYYIIEISSFQLEGVKEFKADGAILLNIAEDHFDRYSDLEEYLKVKWNIFRNQDERDWAILNEACNNYWEGMPKLSSRVWTFSSKGKVKSGCYIEDGAIYYTDGLKDGKVISIDEINLRGMHNIENVMACIIAGKQEGISEDSIRRTVRLFKSLPHRMELVAIKDGVSFINDSKATNPDAVIKALEGRCRDVLLILGGKDKQLNYDVLVEPIKRSAKFVVLIGEAKEAIYKGIRGSGVEIEEALTMEEAVRKAYLKSESGDIVMLSPACASFDMFQDYSDRGNAFKKAVLDIIGEKRKED